MSYVNSNSYTYSNSQHVRSGLGEVLCSAYLVACNWPFLKGLFGTGKHGIPLSTIIKPAMLVFFFNGKIYY
jgi:hypothetical protein